MIAAVRSEVSVNDSVLHVAFELGKKEWKLAMTSGFGSQPWLRTVAGGDLGAVSVEADMGAYYTRLNQMRLPDASRSSFSSGSRITRKRWLLRRQSRKVQSRAASSISTSCST